jgi:hypothetical protein
VPAQITHEVFAQEAFDLAIGRVPSDPQLAFGAQGPDFCLHSHRTKPTGLIFGQLLHSEGYGTFVRHLVEYGRRNGLTADSPFGVFVASFATHAVLDRATHPFINYFSGWVTPRNPESEQYSNCHAFYERIIDVFVLRVRAGESIDRYDFFPNVDCGEDMPPDLSAAISEAIVSTYPEYSSIEKVKRRIENAYFDTRNFYVFTNPLDGHARRIAYEREHGLAGTPTRLLALFHPTSLPELDYLNGARGDWNHPGIAEEKHTESFFDLYEAALNTAAEAIRAVADALEGRITDEQLEATVGNENLSDGRKKKIRRKLEIVRPLPLQDVLRSVYEGA